MKVKELFDTVPFDQLVPELIPLIEDRPQSLHRYRMAYDLIKSYEPRLGCCDSVLIAQGGPEESLDIRFLDGVPWPNSLAKEIVYEGDGDFSPQRVAAACLNEMTFCGFSEQEITRAGDELGFYERFEGPGKEAYERMLTKVFKRYPFQDRNKRQNRAKRKRMYRHFKRCEKLKQQMIRESLILRMGKVFPIEELRFLMDVDYMDTYFYSSTVTKGDERLSYLRMLMNYQQQDFSIYDGALLGLIVPSNFPWPDRPWEAFKQDLQEFFGLPIRFGIVRKEASREEIGGWLLLFKRRHG